MKLIRHLERNWGYTVDRQTGSHIVLVTASPRNHSVPIPRRSALGLGLLRAILSQISEAKGVSVDDLLRDL